MPNPVCPLFGLEVWPCVEDIEAKGRLGVDAGLPQSSTCPMGVLLQKEFVSVCLDSCEAGMCELCSVISFRKLKGEQRGFEIKGR